MGTEETRRDERASECFFFVGRKFLAALNEDVADVTRWKSSCLYITGVSDGTGHVNIVPQIRCHRFYRLTKPKHQGRTGATQLFVVTSLLASTSTTARSS